MSARPVLTLIAAVSADGFISTGRGVPWNLPRDKEHFRRTTRGQWLLLGRITYEEMIGWFDDRHPLVLTRDPSFIPPVGEKVATVEEALHKAGSHGARELFNLGGSGAFAAAMPLADRLILTHVDSTLGAGVPFPPVDPAEWQATSQQDFPADAANPQSMRFVTYERVRPPAGP
ncbi:dihydrofolate reductase [Prosthecobacter sp.]|uniref:dihydrofolate reductase n=1 Tax=Prosthecobacter sp. TaxID=1965333 RepID=UPI003785289D